MSNVMAVKMAPELSLPRSGVRGSVAAGAALIAVFFGGLGGWAAYAPLNGAVVAPATVKVEGNRKSIQHLDGGIVQELLVREGSRVEAGQTLIVLDRTQPQAALDILLLQDAMLRAQEARFVAERDEAASIAFPADLAARRDNLEIRTLLDTEQRQFTVRRAALDGQIAVLRQRIEQLQEQVRGGKAQQTALERQIALIGSELRDQHELLGKGLTQRPRVLELERNAAALRGQQGEVMAQIARLQQAMGEIELSILQSRNDRLTDISRELRDVQSKLVELVPRLRAAKDVLARSEIRSPYAGYVVDLAVFSVGGVIQRGERVMDVVPSDSALVLEANVAVDDIHEVHPGMRGEIHLSAYKQRVMPAIHGDIVEIAADRLTDKRTGTPYFTAVVKMDASELAWSAGVELLPGMAATVIIPTTPRTALEYLIGPFVASLNQAFRQK